MKKKLGPIRDRLVNRLSGIDVRATANAVNEAVAQEQVWREIASQRQEIAHARQVLAESLQADRESVNQWQAAADVQLREIFAQVEFASRRQHVLLEALKIERDHIPELQTRLSAVRETAEYRGVHDLKDPLVSVRIATFDKTEELMDVAIASVLAQSYENFEIVVVNDGPNEKTRRAVIGLNDMRVRYAELPERGRYPSDPHSKWMVAGSPAMNRAASLCEGAWIAPLDDDDEFTADHIEKLVILGNKNRAELSYGALIQRNLKEGGEKKIWSSPPAISEFSFQGAIYLRLLNFFQYDQQSWLTEEPGDWNLIRRMSLAGVNMACTQDVVAIMNMVPYTLKDAK
ncbi:glycosyltransferase family 2 protein [Cryobacterium sp. Y11]|uniref:glycosyltransferase family 2 protein n=1 Tax=Cryobacterium sp. Y11 TaxID=2045016 RepID=UPI000CE324BA|nr:glycosyltransferase family 2 protein [Cryobacterium sp. Y11]